MGALQTMRIILPLIVLLVGAVVGFVWLVGYLYDKRWTQEKILPLYAKVSAMDPESREYLDPAIIDGIIDGKLTLDQAIALQHQRR